MADKINLCLLWKYSWVHNTLRGGTFAELIFAILAIDRESEFRGTYKILNKQTNAKIWWYFNSKKQTSINKSEKWVE